MKTIFFNSLPLWLALGTSVLFTISIIDLARKKKLYELNNKLKQHVERVSSLGGISIYTSFWIAISLAGGLMASKSLCFLLAGSFILFLAGVKDDLVGITALRRLAIQIGVASLLFAGGIQLNYLPFIEGELPVTVSYLLTIFLFGAIVNAYNFIDGINGLAGGLAIISALVFSILFSMAGATIYVAVSIALAGAVAGFLWFNFGEAKIFMGDSGSTFIGIIISFLFVSFLQPGIYTAVAAKVSPVVLLAILIVPMADMIKVVLGRMLGGRSPFKGDRTHIHHLMRDRRLSQQTVCWILYAWNILVILFSLFLLPQNMLYAGLVVLMVGGVPYLALRLSASQKKEKKSSSWGATEAGELL